MDKTIQQLGFSVQLKTWRAGTAESIPLTGGISSVDPIRDGSNWFSYVINDPVNYVDPLGLNPISDFVDGAKDLAGKASLDVDFSHGNGDGSHTFPHLHKWDWTKNQPRQ